MRVCLTSIRVFCSAALLVVAGADAQSQPAWPDKPITMIVPFPPGGVADTVARPVAEALARELKTTVVVENRAGAGGALGIGVAARAPADGYTVLLSLSSISILPEADRILERKPAYQLSQFKPIARFTADPTVLVVRADARWKTLAEFLADVRAHPGTYNYGSSGNYGTMHVPMEMLKAAGGLSHDAHPVHRRRAGGGRPARRPGRRDRERAVDGRAADPGRQAPRARPLGRASARGAARRAEPEAARPPGALRAVVGAVRAGGDARRCHQEAARRRREGRRRPDVRQVIAKAGSPIEYLDAPEFQTYWDADAAEMTQAVKAVGRVE